MLGILIATRGTLNEEARKNCLEELRLSILDRFDEAEVDFAYTDELIRKHIKEKEGIKYSSVKVAMLKMKEKGVTELIVLPVHVIAGDDYTSMSSDVASCAGVFNRIRVAGPLVEFEQDFDLCARAFVSTFKERVGDGTLILMGRGSAIEETEETFLLFEEKLKEYFGGRAYICTIEGKRNLSRVLYEMKKNGNEGKTVVVPFMFLVEDYILEHLNSGENSYEDRLRAQGYEPECVENGIGEYEDFHRLYLKHLYDAIRKG